MVTDITKIANVQEVELPGWNEEPFVCKLRRPSLLALAKSGKIPNQLLACANELFSKGSAEKAKLNELYEVLKIVAEASLVEPTLDEIFEANLELTDVQLMSIFNYSQIGIKGLARFREISRNPVRNSDIK